MATTLILKMLLEIGEQMEEKDESDTCMLSEMCSSAICGNWESGADYRYQWEYDGKTINILDKLYRWFGKENVVLCENYSFKVVWKYEK